MRGNGRIDISNFAAIDIFISIAIHAIHIWQPGAFIGDGSVSISSGIGELSASSTIYIFVSRGTRGSKEKEVLWVS